jgi:hypothetical protein
MKRTYQDRKAKEPESEEVDESEDDAFIYFSKEEIEKSGRIYVNMPKKGLYRMHAHINPFNPLSIPFPLNTTYVDWALHYPAFYGKPNNTIAVNTKKHPITNNYKTISEN